MKTKCNGKECRAVDGIGHSNECVKEHETVCSHTEEVPSCFARAEYQGRAFDNCMFFETCKSVKPICTNNPVSDSREGE